MVNRFSNFKGKLKKMATKNEKSVVTNEKSMRRKTVPQSIRSRRNTGLTRPSLRTTEMEDTAKSFSSTAKELLSVVEFNKQSSKS
ncbi:hypothetical protein ARALYDRAFT_903295 [Arabidopsis lyrata subsp. lyrata]|uniref:Uncharacterized protein n=1 Tax=Arabidopsis lyrata subsp. lyrata TaxID=81972 RepID=D7LEG9_ARALL|nr:hypothetical protein ARALYDRAFT_903295 [Arabidopsis lyrata subsp. lyrata]